MSDSLSICCHPGLTVVNGCPNDYRFCCISCVEDEFCEARCGTPLECSHRELVERKEKD